ncbi:unnamed protein product, partial [Rotaria magnacalcarata]
MLSNNDFELIMDNEKYFLLQDQSVPTNRGFYTSDKRTTAPQIKFKRIQKFEPKKQAIGQITYLNQCIIARLMPFITSHHTKGKVLFWSDLASSHYGHNVLQYLDQNDVQFGHKEFNLQNCPQARPIETLWSILKNMVYDDGWEAKIINQLLNIPVNAKWAQNGVTVAGVNGRGDATNQLYNPDGLFVDDDQTVVIADYENHRISQWKNGDTTNGQVVAGGKGAGNELRQLNYPTDVLIDKETDSLIICDQRNERVVRWSRLSGTTQGEILIDNIACFGLAMGDQRYLYVSDTGKDEVRRYQLGEKNSTLVAGGNGQGDGLNQLNWPVYLFVDRDHSVYVSDNYNHRV